MYHLFVNYRDEHKQLSFHSCNYHSSILLDFLKIPYHKQLTTLHDNYQKSQKIV